MLPSSSRVKLNRVALKDVIGLKLVPRRRRVPRSPNNATAGSKKEEENQLLSERIPESATSSSNEPVQTCLTEQLCPENEADTAGNLLGAEQDENCVGTPKTKRKKICQSKEGKDSLVCKEEGPFTRGKYHQRKPNTRSKSRLDCVRKLCTWCFCTAPDIALIKRTEVRRWMKLRRRISKMSCKIKLSDSFAKSKATQSQEHSVVRSSVGKWSSRCKSRQSNIDRKTPVTHVARSGRERRRGFQGKVKAKSCGWDCQPPTENTARTEKHSIPTGLSNIHRNTHPSPTGPTDLEASLKRVDRSSGCGLCGDCLYISPRRKTVGKPGQKSSSPGPEQPAFEVMLEGKKTVPETSEKINIRIERYPKVTLCDIAQKCHSFSQNCGYLLPDVLKTKAVHCFKQDMRAAFRFGPCCFGNNKQESEKGAQAQNTEKNVCQSQNLTPQQSNIIGCKNSRTFSSHTTCCFLNSQTSEGSTTCSASLLLGKRIKEGECRTDMREREIEKEPGPGYPPTRAEFCGDKRKKLGDSVEDGILPSTSDLESISSKNSDCSDKEKTCFWVSNDSQSCSEHVHEVGGCSTFGPDVTEDSVHKKPGGDTGSLRKTDAAQMSSELSCQRMDTDEPESFTCQRVRIYLRKINLSCARTYMSWPFSNIAPTLTAHAGTTARPAESADPPTKDYCVSPINQNQPDLSSKKTNDVPPDSSTDPSTGTTLQIPHENDVKKEEDRECVLAESNGRIHSDTSSYSSDSKDMEFGPHLMEAEDSQASLPSDTASLSNSSQSGTDTVSPLSLLVNGPETNSSMSTPSPSALGLCDWETATTLSPMSSPFKHGSLTRLSVTSSSLPPSPFRLKTVKGVKLSDAHSVSASPAPSPPTHVVKSVEKPLFCCEETQMTSGHNSDSFHHCESSLLAKEDQESDGELLTGRFPPKLKPYYNTSPINHDCALFRERSWHDVFTEQAVGTCSNEFMLPPVLSPVASPIGSETSVLPQSPGCSDEEEEVNKEPSKYKVLPECHMPQIVYGNNEKSKDELEHFSGGFKGASSKTLPSLSEPKCSPSRDEDVDDGNEEESRDETHTEDIEQVPSDPKIQAFHSFGSLRDTCSSSSDEEDSGALIDEGQPCSSREEGSSKFEKAGSERHQNKAEADGETQQNILDEFTAYEQDILLVDVIQDDPELFENLPRKSILKLGPTRATETPKTRPVRVVKTLLPRREDASLKLTQRLNPVHIDFHCDSPDIKEEESDSRSWRPQCSSNPATTKSYTWTSTEKQTKNWGQPDANNNRVNGYFERSQPIQTVTSLHNRVPALMTVKNGPWSTIPANAAEFKRQPSNAYCRQYFSESLSCGFKMCWFLHVPLEGDEKFCIETVTRFTKNPMCLQRAGAVFTGYYQNNPPGVYFSMPVLLSLLWALLRAGMVSDVFSVLSISLAHKIVPGHEFLLALFNCVREKRLMGFVPELMQLTCKMASAGLGLSLDCLDSVKNTPELQQTSLHVSVTGNYKLSTSAPFPEYLNLAHAIVEIELCAKQEDWKRMGEVFRSICQSSQRPSQVERISGCVAIALLSESKDKLSLPFAAFAETVCQNEEVDSPNRSFLGRIGVSLMLRYHKTHQWVKGRKVVEALSISKVNYSTLKGLFGNEDGASRCLLVTVATELFLLSGSVEGALNTLRENKWFVSSCSWPCEPADLESRTRVLTRLAEKTSHRDSLDVLSNLPGLKETSEMVDISRYGPLFNSHLQVCLDRQTLPVASDTVDFMLSKNLAVDHAMLQKLLHKLGKQNLWLRAREVFRHSLSVGYYPGVSAPPGFMGLIVPYGLGEVELALAFEMFITVNATVLLHLPDNTTSSLTITLKRTQSCESEYLSAGSRLLSAACIPQPKLIVHYTAVNASQEQVFTLDISSARFWLRHNHLWANEVWTH